MKRYMLMGVLVLVASVRVGALVATEAAKTPELAGGSGDAPDQNAWLKPQVATQMHPHIPASEKVAERSLVDLSVALGKKAVTSAQDFFYDEKGDFQRERAQLVAAFVAGMVVRGRFARLGAIWAARYKK